MRCSLAEEIAKRGVRDELNLKRAVIGSERWGHKMRQRIANELGVKIYDIYGLTEVYGPRHRYFVRLRMRHACLGRLLLLRDRGSQDGQSAP